MERIWRLLVAIFLLCAGTTLLVVAWVFDSNGIAVVAIYAALALIPIGLIKGFYVFIKFGFKDEEPKE